MSYQDSEKKGKKKEYQAWYRWSRNEKNRIYLAFYRWANPEFYKRELEQHKEYRNKNAEKIRKVERKRDKTKRVKREEKSQCVICGSKLGEQDRGKKSCLNCRMGLRRVKLPRGYKSYVKNKKDTSN